MNNIKPLVLSDIHLEKINPLKQKFLLSAINERVAEVKNEGFTPLVIFAGDVNNSTKGYEFMSQVNSDILYVAGNHEFWEGDYYETLNKLQFEAPDNVTFLHNDVAIFGDYLFLGTTLWTDVGQNLNNDLLKYAGLRMNDMTFMTAMKWYDDEQNIKKIKDAFPLQYSEKMIKERSWNALIEIEENQKSWQFLANCESVIKALNKAEEIRKRLESDISSQFPWSRVSKKIVNDIEEKIDFSKENLSWTNFIDNLNLLDNRYSISELDKNEFLENSPERNYIFQKMRIVQNITNKKITILSHHLPFYEEILVGTRMKEYLDLPIKLVNQTEQNLFLIRSGKDYPQYKYLSRAQQGEIERAKDITHIVNYYNDGSHYLGSFLQEKISMWIHGHEHHFQFCDYVKGIKILTNPSGSSLSLLDATSGIMKLNPHYISYNNIKGDEELKEINKIKRGLVAEPGHFVNQKQLENAVQLWALKNFNWDECVEVLKKIDKAAKELLLLSIEYIQNENLEEDSGSRGNSEIENKSSSWHDSYNFNCEKLAKIHEELSLAFRIRTDKSFTFQNHLTNSLQGFVDVYSWTMGNASPPEPIINNLMGVWGAEKYFQTKGNIKIALKHIEKLREFLENTTFKHVYEVRENDIFAFIDLSQKALPKERVAEKIQEKWEAFCQKTFEDGQPPHLFKGSSLDF